MNRLSVDFHTIIADMKPLHGVNNGPVTINFRYDARPLFQQAGIPFSRLHDTEYPFGSGEFVDVNCLFPNFQRDPQDASAYNFALTDQYLHYIQDTGAQIIYRLGCTIEHQKTKRYIYPPSDPLRWARVCEQIIRHYNEGWADGYHLNIRYWEIWNEPDGILWLGSPQEFYRFFETVILHLKQCFPDLFFGGPALCVGSNDFAEGLMAHLSSRQPAVPLDFYSWHTYSDTVEKVLEEACKARALLDRHGYTHTRSILDEWNWVRDWEHVGDAWEVIQSPRGAAFNAAVLAALQNSSCDIATYYDAQMCFDTWWNGMFGKQKTDSFFQDMEGVCPKKGYYPFLGYGELYRLGKQAIVDTDADCLYAVAASNGRQHALMLTYYHPENLPPIELSLRITGAEGFTAKLCLLDETHDLELVEQWTATPDKLLLECNTTMLIRWQEDE